jgi:WD40 repeat protein
MHPPAASHSNLFWPKFGSAILVVCVAVVLAPGCTPLRNEPVALERPDAAIDVAPIVPVVTNECDGGPCPTAPDPVCPGPGCPGPPPVDALPPTVDPDADGKPAYPTACPGGVVRFWDLAAEPKALDYSPDGTRIAVGTADGTVQVFQAVDGREVGSHKHMQRIESVRFAPDNGSLASASDDGTLSLWTMGTTPPKIWVHGPMVLSAAFSPDGTFLLVGTQVGLYLLKTAVFPAAPPHFDGAGFRSVAYLPGGMEVVAIEGGAANRIVRLKAADLTAGLSPVVAHPFDPIGPLAVPARSGVWLAYGVAARLILVGITNGTPAMFDQHHAAIEDARFSNDGLRLVTTGADATKIWTVGSWAVQRTLPGASAAAVFSPDGKQLARIDGKRVLLHCID